MSDGSNGSGLFEKDQRVRFTEAALKSDCCVGKAGRDYLVTNSRLVSPNELRGNRHRQKIELKMICNDGDCRQTESRLSGVSGFLLELVTVAKPEPKPAEEKPESKSKPKKVKKAKTTT